MAKQFTTDLKNGNELTVSIFFSTFSCLQITIDDGFPPCFLQYLVTELLILANRHSIKNPTLTGIHLSIADSGNNVFLEWIYDSSYDDPKPAPEEPANDNENPEFEKVSFLIFLVNLFIRMSALESEMGI